MHKTIQNYKWLIFDADNTLFDYDKAEKLALLKTLDKHNITYPLDTIVTSYHQINRKIWMQFEKGEIKSQHEIKLKRTKQLFELLNARADETQFANDYLYHLSQNNYLLSNAIKVIEFLSRSLNLVIMTNGMTSVQKPRFKTSPITKYFQHIIISEEIKYAKPSVEIYDHAFKLMGQPNKKDVIMIGDSLASDIQGGINYQIDTVWYNPSSSSIRHHATYEVNDLIEFIVGIYPEVIPKSR